MNDWDRNNLHFILSLNENEFQDWFECLSDDDVAYAIELIKIARAEVAVQLASLNDDIKDVSDAAQVLKKFTLKGQS